MSKLPVPPRQRSMFKPTPASLERGLLEGVNPQVRMDFVAQRLPASLISKVDAYAEKEGISRSEAIRRILAAALNKAGDQ